MKPNETTGHVPRLDIQGMRATITLSRPEHRNRLHPEDLQVLMAHFREINSNQSIRVLVLTSVASGDRPVFCAGYHIGEHGLENEGARFEDVADTLENLRCVTICALGGSVFGGATDLVLACDFAVGVRGMQMRMPAAMLGMHYYPGGISRYVSRLGVAAAKKAFLAAEIFSDEELLRIGYIQTLVSPEELQEAVDAKVNVLTQLAPLAQESLKRSIQETARGEFDPDLLRQRQYETQTSSDFTEGCLAFAEKRAPNFKGR